MTLREPTHVRFWDRVVKSDDPLRCWIWQPPLDPGGYGKITHNGHSVFAHRWSYERYIGPIPKGMWIDHLCRNRACVNPAHLEMVTPSENLRRAREANEGSPRKAKVRMTRQQVCGRISALRSALDTLASQSGVDGHGHFLCVGKMKVELIALEGQLRAMDGLVSAPPHATMLADAIVAHQGSRRVG